MTNEVFASFEERKGDSVKEKQTKPDAAGIVAALRGTMAALERMRLVEHWSGGYLLTETGRKLLNPEPDPIRTLLADLVQNGSVSENDVPF
jgi:hypothetical protein